MNDKIRKTSLVLLPDGREAVVRGIRIDLKKEFPPTGKKMFPLPEMGVPYALVSIGVRYAGFHKVSDLKLVRNWTQ